MDGPGKPGLFLMTKKYRFKFRPNGVVIEVDAWDVAGMVKSTHDWECMDDVAELLLGEDSHVLNSHKAEPVVEAPEVIADKPRRGRPPLIRQ